MRRLSAFVLASPLALGFSCVVPIDDVEPATGGAAQAGSAGLAGSSANGGAGGATGGVGGSGATSGGTGGTGGAGGTGSAGTSGTAGAGGANGGSGGTPADASPDASGGTSSTLCAAACPHGCVELGRIATWCGKVNVHLTAAGWVTDADCSSGCFADKLTYCKKFYPGTIDTQDTTPVDQKVFQSAGCVGQNPFVGQAEYICLGCSG